MIGVELRRNRARVVVNGQEATDLSRLGLVRFAGRDHDPYVADSILRVLQYQLHNGPEPSEDDVLLMALTIASRSSFEILRGTLNVDSLRERLNAATSDKTYFINPLEAKISIQCSAR